MLRKLKIRKTLRDNNQDFSKAGRGGGGSRTHLAGGDVALSEQGFVQRHEAELTGRGASTVVVPRPGPLWHLQSLVRVRPRDTQHPREHRIPIVARIRVRIRRRDRRDRCMYIRAKVGYNKLENDEDVKERARVSGVQKVWG